MEAKTLGLVVEGGGIRGIYAAGVLDVLHDLHLPFNGAIGVSAGAIHVASFVSGQKERSLRIYTRFCADDRFFSFKNWLKTGNIVDNDFCYHELPSIHEPFDNEAFIKSPMKYYTTCTDLETGQAAYFLLTDLEKEIDGLIASASLPYVSRPVRFRGRLLLDGGCSDRVPLKAFESMGYARNIVILTQPRSHKVKDRDAWLARLFYRKYPKFCQSFENSSQTYEDTQRYIDKARLEKRAFVIRPSAPLNIPRLTHNPDDVRRGYEAGRRDALVLIDKLKQWLETSHRELSAGAFK